MTANHSLKIDVSRGTKQSNLRAHNERLLLSLVRHTESLAKADIARLTGLSPQTISVITGTLESDGLILRGDPIRGRVGQPSIPLRLNPDGVYSIGINVGRRKSSIVLVNFVGEITAETQTTYAYPQPEDVLNFVKGAIAELTNSLGEEQRSRIAGVGISTPFELFNWVESMGAPGEHVVGWKEVDLLAEVESMTQYPCFIQNDATAACRAELVTGSGSSYGNYLYFFVGEFIGGGVVLNGSLYPGRTGNAGAIGSMLVTDESGSSRQLIDSASLWLLEDMLKREGIDPSPLWARGGQWPEFGSITQRWIVTAAKSMASAIASSCSVIDFEAIIVDGAFPSNIRDLIVESINEEIKLVDFAGIERPLIVPGTVGSNARVIGAATIPLSMRFLLDQNLTLDKRGQ